MALGAILPYVLAAASVASTAVSIYSNIQQGNEAEEAADKAAAQTRAAAQQRALDTEKQHRRIIATQEASYGASGLTMEGSPLLVQMESLKESEEQLRRIREGGELTAGALEERGSEAKTSGYVKAGGSLLSGASSFSNIGKTYASPGKTMFNWW